MPEGDTIYRTARSLRAALAGKEVLALAVPGDPSAAAPARPVDPRGRRVLTVESRGKHVLIRFDDGSTLRSHMGMPGSWHLYRPGERIRRSPRSIRARLEVHDVVAVCFAAPEVALTTRPAIEHLGPDLLAATPDFDEAERRFDALPADTPVAVALLDQRVAAGIGNIWRAETMHACGVHPMTPVGALDAAQRRALMETASALLRRSAEGGRHRAVVYGRGGRPCGRCGTIVQSKRVGEHARVVYWCPSCQPALSEASSRAQDRSADR